LSVERHKPWVLHFVDTLHLLYEQQRVGADVKPGGAVRERPFKGSDEAAIFGDVIRSDADRLGKFLDQRPVFSLDSHAEPRRARVSAGAAVDIGDHDGTVTGT
jgi:hypothetical protein